MGQVNVLAGILNKGEKDRKSNVCWLKPLVISVLIACGEEETKDSSTTTIPKTTATNDCTTNCCWKEAPDFTLQSMDGKEVSYLIIRVKRFIWSFGLPWCGPCKKSMPELMELARRNQIVISKFLVSLHQEFKVKKLLSNSHNGSKIKVIRISQFFMTQKSNHIPSLSKSETFLQEYLIDSQGKIGKIQFRCYQQRGCRSNFKEMN